MAGQGDLEPLLKRTGEGLKDAEEGLKDTEEGLKNPKYGQKARLYLMLWFLTRFRSGVDLRFHGRSWCLQGLVAPGSALFEHHLDLGQIVLRVSLEDHAGALEVDLPRRQLDLVLVLLHVGQQLLVRAPQLGPRPPVYQ